MIVALLVYLCPAVVMFIGVKFEMDYGPATVGDRIRFSLLWPLVLVYMFLYGKRVDK